MTRGDTGSQGENTGVDKEWWGEGEVVVCFGAGFSKHYDRHGN